MDALASVPARRRRSARRKIHFASVRIQSAWRQGSTVQTSRSRRAFLQHRHSRHAPSLHERCTTDADRNLPESRDECRNWVRAWRVLRCGRYGPIGRTRSSRHPSCTGSTFANCRPRDAVESINLRPRRPLLGVSWTTAPTKSACPTSTSGPTPASTETRLTRSRRSRPSWLTGRALRILLRLLDRSWCAVQGKLVESLSQDILEKPFPSVRPITEHYIAARCLPGQTCGMDRAQRRGNAATAPINASLVEDALQTTLAGSHPG